MNDTMVTVVGNVVDSPRLVRTQNGSVTNFRVASTARRYDAVSEGFIDANTFYIDVECWNDMSSNVSGSVSKGDPVIVSGTISTHSWDTDAGRRSRPQIRAVAVGHNLARGTGLFTRKQSSRSMALLAGAAGPGGADLDEHDDPMDGGAGELVAGRDYEGVDDALYDPTSADRAPEPAHA